jgi:hypothetical protein
LVRSYTVVFTVPYRHWSIPAKQLLDYTVVDLTAGGVDEAMRGRDEFNLLERAGVTKRPVIKMTASKLARAKELYDLGWSTQKIGRELDVSQGAVCKALRRAGVRMRAPVA